MATVAASLGTSSSSALNVLGSAVSTGHTSHFMVVTDEPSALRRIRAPASAGSCADSESVAACSGCSRRSIEPGQRASITGASPPTSISQSASIGGTGELKQVANDGGFSPVNVVAGIAGKKGAMASVGRFNKRNVRIGRDLGAGFGSEANEGIVECVQDERGQRDAIDNAGSSGAVVVVVGILE